MSHETTSNMEETQQQETLDDASIPHITELNRYDVLLGRGASIDRFEGNVRFRQLVRDRKVEYSSLTSADDKNRIAHEIIANVHCSNGRFLRAVNVASAGGGESQRTPKTWIQVSIKAAMEKVKQALRDCCIVQDATTEQNQQPRETSADGVAVAIERSSIPMGNVALLQDDAPRAINSSQWNHRPLHDVTSSTSHGQQSSSLLHPILLSLMQSSHRHPQSSQHIPISDAVSQAMASLDANELLRQQQSNSTNFSQMLPYFQYQDVNDNSSFSPEHATVPTPEDPTLPSRLAQLQQLLTALGHQHSSPSSHHRQQPGTYTPISVAGVQHPAMASSIDSILLSQPQSNPTDSLLRSFLGTSSSSSSSSSGHTMLSPLHTPPEDDVALQTQLVHLQQQLVALSHRHPPPHSYEPALNVLSTAAAAPAAVTTTNPLSSASQWRQIPAVYIHRLIPLMREPSGPTFTGADLDVLLRTKHLAEAAHDSECLVQIRHVLESVVLSPHIRRELHPPELQTLCTVLQGMISSS